MSDETQLAVMEKPKTGSIKSGQLSISNQTLEPKKIIEAAMASGYFKHLKSPADGYIIAAYGASLNMDITTALNNIILVNGRMTFSANFIASLIKRSGKYRYRVKAKTAKECVIEFFEKIEHCTKEGRQYWEWELQGTETFTYAMAERAGLTQKGTNWKSWPEAMCFARCITAGARTYCPDLLNGQAAYTPDEIEPSIKLIQTPEGDLVPDAEYVVAQPVAKPADTARLAEIRDLMTVTGTDEKSFLQTLLKKDSLDQLTAGEQDKVVAMLKQKKAAF